jgi:hypothetical protein
VCIATSFILSCTNKECKFLYRSDPPAATTVHALQDDNFERSTDYAINVLYVLGFISVGDGCSEAGRMLGLLGLPNDTTMESRSFQIIESRLGPIIRKLCKDIIQENLEAEVKASLEESKKVNKDSTDIDKVMRLWKASLTDESIKLSDQQTPFVYGSYDMAWQQKGSGRQYNSNSGHGTMMGMHTRKVIALGVRSKLCNKCDTFKKKFPLLPLPYHQSCFKNHEGSSGAMEAAVCLELVVVHLSEKMNVGVRRLCCDDDSSVRADCQWSNADHMTNNNMTELPQVAKKVGKNKGELQPRPDKGKLPRHVPEPLFVADPNHRRKGLTGDLIALASANVDARVTMTRMDSTRIGKNFGYMARSLRCLPCDSVESLCEDAATAVLEHHFDSHEYCGDWCRRKNESMESRKTSGKYYRCKERDKALYDLLDTILARFVTKDGLKEMAHGLDTNMNEAFNNICTWYAPKNKMICGTGSLHNRISFAVGVNSIGVELYFKRLYEALGITVTANMEHYQKMKEQNRHKRLVKIRTRTAKVNKNKNKYNKLQEYTKIAKMELHKRSGTYRKGMNLDDPEEITEHDCWLEH